MKLCPQCEFIYEDDQSFCDMDGKELVYDVSQRVFSSKTAALPAQFPEVCAASTVTGTPAPTPSLMPGPLPSPARLPANQSVTVTRQSRSLAVAAIAAVVLVALLFVVYYARTHSSRTRKANRTSSQAVSQSDQSNGESNSQPVAPASDTQPAATDSSSESTTSLAETTPSEQSPERKSEAERSASLAPQSSSSLPTGSEKSVLRTLQSASPVAARAASETNRASVVIRLTNGASIKADEAWEKKEGIWYRQAGMVTFLKRSRVRSIQRLTPANRSQTEPRPGTSIAQNQPRVGKPVVVNTKKDSKVTSFLKKTGRILKKPFKL